MANDLNRSIKIYIDNSDAMSKAEGLRSKISELENNLKSLAAQGQKDTAGYKKQQKQLEQTGKQYGVYQNRIRETERVLKNLSGATYKELQTVQRVLRRELQQTTRGTEEYSRKLKIYNRVQKEITVTQREMNSQYGRQASAVSKMTNGFNKYFGIATAFIASITGMSFAFRKLSQDAAAMEDTYADVMKTTGLTREEVGDLNEELKKMDTRTAREQLNLLARDAGKLGMSSKKDILDFVEAGNIINVALGEDLGEDAIKQIGKMSNVFQKATEEIEDLDLKGRMLSIGSAVNEVAQSSSASEPYLVAFAGRLGGVAAQAGIGIDKILGFASALDQDMQAVEMSATALQKLIIKIMSSPAEFAAIANMEVGKFTNLLQTDANEAIKTVLRALNEKGGFQQLIPIFQEMGLDGARAVGVLSSMANGIDRIDEAQSIANKSMIEATSVMDEYNIKNHNAQAELEKRKKAFKDAAEELGNRLNPALLKSTNYLTYLIKVLPAVLDFFAKYGKYIMYLAGAYAIYTAGVKLNVLWETKLKTALTLSNAQMVAKNVLLKALRISTMAYNVVVGLLTGNFTMMRRAWKLMTAAMASNPIGLLLVAATAAVTGIVKLVKWINRTSDATKALKEATQQFNSELASEQRKVKELFDILKRTNPESETHLRVRKQLVDTYGPYLEGLINEKGEITNIGDALAIVNNHLRQQIALKIRNQAADTIVTDALEEQMKNTDKIIKKISKEVPEQSQAIIRESINKMITDFTSSGDSDFSKLERAIGGMLQSDYDIDIRKGVFGNVKSHIDTLIKDLKEGKDGVEELDARYAGMIDNWTKLPELDVVGGDGDTENASPAPGVTSAGSDKDIYKEKLAVLDAYLIVEKNKLLQARYEGTINQEQYLRQLEQLEMDGLQKKMDIYQLDSEQQIGVQNLIYEKKIAIMQQLIEDEKTYQQKLLDIQIKADQARAEQNWANLKLIAKQNQADAKAAFDKQNKQTADMAALGMEFSNDMGQMVGGFISGNEDLVASSLKNIINMGLDLLKVQVQMAIAGATAASLAQPDSVATFGAAGFARAAVMVGLIEAAFAGVKAVVSSAIGNMGSSKTSATISNDSLTGQRVVTQRQHGKYDVIGADDGRTYHNVPYIGDARTGVVSTPTLMGEYGGELVVNAPDFRALQRHVNYPLVLQAIQQSRQPGAVPQRAEGNYSQVPSQQMSTVDNTVMAEMLILLRYLKENGLQAHVVLSDLQRKQELLSQSQKIGTKR